MAENVKIYQIKVTLRRTRPPIWRRLQVAGDTKLGKLHRVLQVTMGWYDAHLHAFRVGRTAYSVPDPEFPTGMRSERNVRLEQIAGEGDNRDLRVRLRRWDRGEGRRPRMTCLRLWHGWEHALKVEKILPAEKGKRYPVCLAGKHACPPEDCGGVSGYAHLLEVLSNAKDEQYEELQEWIGPDFEPEAFDLDQINRTMSGIR
jgi:Plasmid pRiA4b ORF-3-like protein